MRCEIAIMLQNRGHGNADATATNGSCLLFYCLHCD